MFVNAISNLLQRSDQVLDARLMELWPRAFENERQTYSGQIITPERSLGFSGLFACVDLISDKVAGLPLYLYKRVGKEGREKAKKHPVFKLVVSKPNPEDTPFDFKKRMVTHLCMNSNTYIEYLTNNRNDPVEMWILDPWRTNVRREDGKRIYKYTIPGQAPKELDVNRLIHLKGFSLDGVKGISRVSLARQGIGTALDMEKYQASFIANDSTPKGYLKTSQMIGAEAKKKQRIEWNKIYGGAANAAKTAILDGDWEYKTLGLTMEDAQFLESRKFSLEEIARWFRVPAHMIGLLDRSTNNNIEQQAREFLAQCLDPYLRNIEEGFGMALLKEHERADYFFEFDREKLYTTDTERMDNALAKRILTAQMSPNEARAERNDLPVKGGDVHLVPASHVPLEMFEEIAAAKLKAPEKTGGNNDGGTNTGEDGDQPKPQDEQDQERAFANSIVKPFARSILARHYRQEEKRLSSKLKQFARRGSAIEWDQWFEAWRDEARLQIQRDLTNVGTTMENLGAVDVETMLRELIDYSITSTELAVKSVIDSQLLDFSPLENTDEKRAEEVVSIFFS